MRAGACEACMNGSCCSFCWCCPWPKARNVLTRAVLPSLVELLRARPDLRGALPLRPLGEVLAEGALWGA